MKALAFGVNVKRSLGILVTFGFAAATVWAQGLSTAEDLYRRTEYRQSLALLSVTRADAGMNNLAGRNYFMMGDFKKAIDYFQRAADSD